MIETRDLDAPIGFEAKAARDEGDRTWLVFVTQAERDLWLCVGPMPAGANGSKLYLPDDREEERISKLAALLGMPWERLDDDFVTLWRLQLRCHAGISDRVAASLASASVDEILGWRHTIESRHPGELLLAVMSGDDPRVVSN